MIELYNDDYFMKEALKEARKGEEAGEIPVGAIIATHNKIIARGYNQTELLNDVTAHAEIIAITSASNHLGSKYLRECTLYVTLEPCVMCAGALFWTQIGKVIYGASDDKRGFMRYGKELLHPTTQLEYGVNHHQCSALISAFFQKLR
ncbi:MAG TPA: nucleoside deaminase [Saprospiraceae bacterium]|nr:nucleoside deaminase [Saprospiraceae bacterium]